MPNPVKPVPAKIHTRQRDAMIVAAFDREPDTLEIAKVFGLTKNYINLIVRNHGRRGDSNPNHAKIGEYTSNPVVRRKMITSDNADFLSAIFTAHARRGTMPPNMTIQQFYNRLRSLNISIPSNLQGLAL